MNTLTLNPEYGHFSIYSNDGSNTLTIKNNKEEIIFTEDELEALDLNAFLIDSEIDTLLSVYAEANEISKTLIKLDIMALGALVNRDDYEIVFTECNRSDFGEGTFIVPSQENLQSIVNRIKHHRAATNSN